MIMDSGSSGRSMAVVEVRYSTSFSPVTSCGKAGTAPVASTIDLAVTGFPSTTRVSGSTKEASPVRIWNPCAAATSAYLVSRSRVISWSFCPTSDPRSTPAAEVGTPGNGLVRAACRVPAAANSVLDGTQPMFTQVPPRVSRSITNTSLPARRAVMAAAMPAPPEPTTTRSTSKPCTICLPLSLVCTQYEPSSTLEGQVRRGSVAKIVKLEHAWRRLDGRNDDGFQVAPFPG